MLSAACWADGLAIVEREQVVEKGGLVRFVSFAELMQ